MTTPTPRTDALVREMKRIKASDWTIDLIALAQSLERYLAASQSEIAALREAIRSETALVHEARTDREMLRNALVKESEFRQETERQRAAAQEARQRAEEQVLSRIIGVATVGNIDGHEVIRRQSAIDVVRMVFAAIDAAREGK